MAPSKYQNYSAASRNEVKIPEDFKFKCRVCKIFKTHNCFSNKELNDVKYKLSQNPNEKLDAQKILVRCRLCSGSQQTELECAHCGKYKSLGEFSKNQRKGGAGWCWECVRWKESQEPGGAATVAPGSEMPGYADDLDDDGNEETTGATLTPAVDQLAQDTNSLSLNTQAASGWVPPHMRGIAAGSARNATSTQSSLSNPYEGARTSDLQSSTAWNTKDTRRRTNAPVMSYNAYDSQGNRQLQYRVPSSRATSTTPSTILGNAASSLRATTSSAAANTPPAARPVPGRPTVVAEKLEEEFPLKVVTNPKTGWAIAKGQRTMPKIHKPAIPVDYCEAPEPEPAPAPRHRSKYDSSDDEM